MARRSVGLEQSRSQLQRVVRGLGWSSRELARILKEVRFPTGNSAAAAAAAHEAAELVATLKSVIENHLDPAIDALERACSAT
jgi:hypothetical protein